MFICVCNCHFKSQNWSSFLYLQIYGVIPPNASENAHENRLMYIEIIISLITWLHNPFITQLHIKCTNNKKTKWYLCVTWLHDSTSSRSPIILLNTTCSQRKLFYNHRFGYGLSQRKAVHTFGWTARIHMSPYRKWWIIKKTSDYLKQDFIVPFSFIEHICL